MNRQIPFEPIGLAWLLENQMNNHTHISICEKERHNSQELHYRQEIQTKEQTPLRRFMNTSTYMP